MNKTSYSFYLFSVISIVIVSQFFMQGTAHTKEIDIVDRSKAEEVMQGKKDAVPYLSQKRIDQIDTTHEYASEKLTSVATWFDSFFDDDRYEAEENQTTARLKLSAGIDRHEDFEFKPRVRLRLHLPRVSDRLNILISANDDEDFDVDRRFGQKNSRDDDANVTVGLQYFLRQTEKMNISSSCGVSYNYAYAGLRFRQTYDYGSWQGRFTSRPRYYTDDGWEVKNQYDLERQVSDKLLFRTTFDADWEEKENGVPHGVTFALFQVLREDRAIQYDMGNYFNTRPNYYMEDMVFSVRYRQRFYRDWLVFEVAPQVSFPQEYDRDFNPGIIFRLEAHFGYKSSEKQFNNIFSF